MLSFHIPDLVEQLGTRPNYPTCLRDSQDKHQKVISVHQCSGACPACRHELTEAHLFILADGLFVVDCPGCLRYVFFREVPECMRAEFDDLREKETPRGKK